MPQGALAFQELSGIETLCVEGPFVISMTAGGFVVGWG